MNICPNCLTEQTGVHACAAIPTPLTDSQVAKTHQGARHPTAPEIVQADFARLLERKFAKAAEWNRLTELEISNLRSLKNELSDDIDLMWDEFARIKACPCAGDEIIGLCDRAISGITQTVPVIEQRDKAEEVARNLERRLAVAVRERDEARAEASRAWGCDRSNVVQLAIVSGDNDALRQRVAELETKLQKRVAELEQHVITIE